MHEEQYIAFTCIILHERKRGNFRAESSGFFNLYVSHDLHSRAEHAPRDEHRQQAWLQKNDPAAVRTNGRIFSRHGAFRHVQRVPCPSDSENYARHEIRRRGLYPLARLGHRTQRAALRGKRRRGKARGFLGRFLPAIRKYQSDFVRHHDVFDFHHALFRHSAPIFIFRVFAHLLRHGKHHHMGSFRRDPAKIFLALQQNYQYRFGAFTRLLRGYAFSLEKLKKFFQKNRNRFSQKIYTKKTKLFCSVFFFLFFLLLFFRFSESPFRRARQCCTLRTRIAV